MRIFTEGKLPQRTQNALYMVNYEVTVVWIAKNSHVGIDRPTETGRHKN